MSACPHQQNRSQSQLLMETYFILHITVFWMFHGAMIAYVFPQLRGSLLSISKLINCGLKVLYCSDFVTGFDKRDKPVF